MTTIILFGIASFIMAHMNAYLAGRAWDTDKGKALVLLFLAVTWEGLWLLNIYLAVNTF